MSTVSELLSGEIRQKLTTTSSFSHLFGVSDFSDVIVVAGEGIDGCTPLRMPAHMSVLTSMSGLFRRALDGGSTTSTGEGTELLPPAAESVIARLYATVQAHAQTHLHDDEHGYSAVSAPAAAAAAKAASAGAKAVATGASGADAAAAAAAAAAAVAAATAAAATARANADMLTKSARLELLFETGVPVDASQAGLWDLDLLLDAGHARAAAEAAAAAESAAAELLDRGAFISAAVAAANAKAAADAAQSQGQTQGSLATPSIHAYETSPGLSEADLEAARAAVAAAGSRAYKRAAGAAVLAAVAALSPAAVLAVTAEPRRAHGHPAAPWAKTHATMRLPQLPPAVLPLLLACFYCSPLSTYGPDGAAAAASGRAAAALEEATLTAALLLPLLRTLDAPLITVAARGPLLSALSLQTLPLYLAAAPFLPALTAPVLAFARAHAEALLGSAAVERLPPRLLRALLEDDHLAAPELACLKALLRWAGAQQVRATIAATEQSPQQNSAVVSVAGRLRVDVSPAGLAPHLAALLPLVRFAALAPADVAQTRLGGVLSPAALALLFQHLACGASLTSANASTGSNTSSVISSSNSSSGANGSSSSSAGNRAGRGGARSAPEPSLADRMTAADHPAVARAVAAALAADPLFAQPAVARAEPVSALARARHFAAADPGLAVAAAAGPALPVSAAATTVETGAAHDHSSSLLSSLSSSSLSPLSSQRQMQSSASVVAAQCVVTPVPMPASALASLLYGHPRLPRAPPALSAAPAAAALRGLDGWVLETRARLVAALPPAAAAQSAFAPARDAFADAWTAFSSQQQEQQQEHAQAQPQLQQQYQQH